MNRESECLYDSYSRRIDYLRVSVIDRCNLRCRYCRPETGLPLVKHPPVLSFEEIARIVSAGVRLGIRKVRLTGGEPLYRRDLARLVRMLSRNQGLEDLALTTNGTLLAPLARDLLGAGLRRVNVSLDTLDPLRYREITRTGRLEDALRGIMAARDVGLHPVKINCVIQESVDEPDALAVAEFGEKEGLEVRFIREMNLELGRFWQVIGGDGGDCTRCNRLRLTCQGKLVPCLFSDVEYDVRQLGIERAFRQAVLGKPESGKRSRHNLFYTIGG